VTIRIGTTIDAGLPCMVRFCDVMTRSLEGHRKKTLLTYLLT